MKLILLLTSLLICGSLANASDDVSIELNPKNPFVIFVDTVRVFEDPKDKESTIEVLIKGPWSLVGFSAVNNTKDRLVIVHMEAYSEDLVGENSKIELGVFSGLDNNKKAIINPRLDTDCDGSVSADEVMANQPGNCPLRPTDLFADRTYLYGMLGDLRGPERDLYRNATFTISVVFEGWFEVNGKPTKNFRKEIKFILNNVENP